MKIEKFSFGMGDRFAHQGEAQLKAILKAKDQGINITPIWNKSNREHKTVKTEPAELRAEADAAVKALGWADSYRVDADHITLATVDGFIGSSDFFTLDVADYIGKPAPEEEIKAFVERRKKYIGSLSIPGIEQQFEITEAMLQDVASKFLLAAIEAGKLYKHIASVKGDDNFIAEVSMDEVNDPQTPVELFFILSALADFEIKAQTIAPKFTGRFNKGVDYVGNLQQFAKEFEEDILVIRQAIKEFGLPENLKLSVHSGSDKFSIYQPINELMKKHDVGIHLKTAGTTWLEEMIGLAEAGNEALELAKEIYINALGRFDELCVPYATVIDVQESRLPSADEVKDWSGEKFANSLRHNQKHPDFNPDFRQMLHVAYKVAGENGDRYYAALKKYRDIVAKNVTENLYERHVVPLFMS
ncbi:tagaturonate epimerase family protein [Mucilaginibacter sp. CSA2-8R]|uniref:tagaturonate epimerase family protein n=1 Tax=Mucilaginibacter sp. CSA2-8R TaxID=3141542 RepID=UPI00315CD42E